MARSFELLEVLQRTTVPVGSRELADRLGVNDRSIRRLISALRERAASESNPSPAHTADTSLVPAEG
nr:HTH domain-containing protein [Arthrobacter roseus]